MVKGMRSMLPTTARTTGRLRQFNDEPLSANCVKGAGTGKSSELPGRSGVQFYVSVESPRHMIGGFGLAMTTGKHATGGE